MSATQAVRDYRLDFLELQHRVAGGQYVDVVDYLFRVSAGTARQIVAVGITGQFHDPAEALGLKKLSKEERIEAAGAWLRSRIAKGYDAFAEGPPQIIDLPPAIMEHWIEHGEIPSWL
jgi:hypothetical protein